MTTAAIRAVDSLTIYNEITVYMKRNGYNVSSWYAGITQDIEQRLFGYHNVSRNGIWIYHKAINTAHARGAEKALLDLGCDGGDGGGDGDAVYIYCYLKTASTRR